jgi:hypothetical protein
VDAGDRHIRVQGRLLSHSSRKLTSKVHKIFVFPTVSMSFLCQDGMLDRLLRQLKVAATNCRFKKTDLLLFGTLLAVYFFQRRLYFFFLI